MHDLCPGWEISVQKKKNVLALINSVLGNGLKLENDGFVKYNDGNALAFYVQTKIENE